MSDSVPVTAASLDAPPVAAPLTSRRPGLGPLRRSIREIGLGLITLGVIILLFVSYQLWGTALAEAHSQASLKKSFSSTVQANTVQAHTAHPATTSPPTSPDAPTVGPATPTSAAPDVSAPPGGALDHLVIPRIGLDKFVVEGVGEDDLRRGPGHYPQTVLPGQAGNAAIAGHRTTYGAPFFRLNQMKVGDPIYVTDLAGRKFVYRVSEPPLVVSPNDVAVLDPTPDSRLTLTTCNPRFSASTRMIVVAKLSGFPAAAPPAVTKSTPPAASPPALAAADTLGSGDHKAWPPAILYGLLVVAAWVGVRLLINRTRRWARAGAFVGGIGVCLVPLWFCFENVVRLLPQNI